METGLSVLVPDGADPGRPFNVVHLLHGICGRSGDWLDYTMLPVLARTGNAIFVMPEVARSFYADQKHGLKYFSYVTDELPRVCADVFRIAAGPEHTAVIGVSMGGYGALRCALSRPDLYGWCGAISSACLYIDEGIHFLRSQPDDAKAAFGEQIYTDLTAVFGPEFVWDDAYGVRALAGKALNASSRPRIFTACGTEDYMLADNRRFRDDMAGMGYPVAYEEWGGAHDWPFFNQALEKALAFCFRG